MLKKFQTILFLAAIFVLYATQLNAEDLWWWLQEYPDLVNLLINSPDQTLKASYRTGPQGDQMVSVKISLKSNKSFVLEMKLPRQAVMTVDPKSGELLPASIDPVVTMRDNNLDGILDDFKMKPGKPPEGATITQDGFMAVSEDTEYQAVYLQWAFAMSYSINHFLHGRESALPRQD